MISWQKLKTSWHILYFRRLIFISSESKIIFTAKTNFGTLFTGDGNIHINVIVPEYTKKMYSMLEPFIFEEVAKLRGSISAEHGVGFRKPQFIHYSKDESALQLMRDLKKSMDPNGILNPYKVLPDVPDI